MLVSYISTVLEHLKQRSNFQKTWHLPWIARIFVFIWYIIIYDSYYWFFDLFAPIFTCRFPYNKFLWQIWIQLHFTIFGKIVIDRFASIITSLIGDRLDHANSREKQHFEAIKLCNEGRFEPALEIWDKLIATQAWDVLALKFYSDVYVLHHIITVLNEFLDPKIFFRAAIA